MRLSLVSIEDGINNIGFRRLSAYARRVLEPEVFYVTTGNQRSFTHLLLNRDAPVLAAADVEAIAGELAKADVVGFSSMTHYAAITAAVIAAVRRRNPNVFIVWGGVHAIIEPEDAIRHADAVCTGEGEIAFEMLLDHLTRGTAVEDTPGFWINTKGGVRRNPNMPLMTSAEMDRLPVPLYQDGECLYRRDAGFVPLRPEDYLSFNGLTYKTVWSIGCPFRCAYCGNSKFIENDRGYRKIRHSSPATLLAELRHALARHPHISAIQFDDDSFMALPLRVLERFAALYRTEIGLPFTVTGLIPTYVRDDKQQVLTAAGLTRVRMGIQSGSQAILDFYERPTPVARIRDSCATLHRYRASMVPPAYDIILDNPLETKEDTQATLDLVRDIPRPFTLNIFSLRIIPNTRLARLFEERGIAAPTIHGSYTRPRPTLANLLVYALVIWRLPEPVYAYLRRRAEPSHRSQRLYPRLGMLLRFLYLAKRGTQHLFRLDITILSGTSIRLMWRLGLVRLWRNRVLPRMLGRRPPILG